MIGIYKITSPSGKIYIGQSVDIERRWRDHKNDSYHCKLRSSFIKHGFENHIFEILEECSIELLNERERFYQDEFDVLGEGGLNLVLTQTNDRSGLFSKETKQKLSDSHLGMTYTDEMKLKSKITIENKGIDSELERRRKISLAQQNRTPEQKLLLSKKNSEGLKRAHKNRTEEQRLEIGRKISESLKGRSVSEETRRKISNTLRKK